LNVRIHQTIRDKIYCPRVFLAIFVSHKVQNI